MKDIRSTKIVLRFYQAFDALKRKHGRGWQNDFLKDTNTDIGNFLRRRREPWREFEMYHLTFIVEKWGVSATWLLTGNGEMFQ